MAGVVREIQIFTTTLKKPYNKTSIVPNAKLSGDNIINYSAEATRRVDMTGRGCLRRGPGEGQVSPG
jgi:small conductance mechanosensitive channel